MLLPKMKTPNVCNLNMPALTRAHKPRKGFGRKVLELLPHLLLVCVVDRRQEYVIEQVPWM